MPLLDLFFTMLGLFLFFIWVWLLISIFADVFRSRDLSGLAKAAWVVILVVLPLLGALAYLVARGDSMQERTVERATAAEAATRDYIRDAAGTTSTADELVKLAQLRDSGVLDENEFRTQKAKLLA